VPLSCAAPYLGDATLSAWRVAWFTRSVTMIFGRSREGRGHASVGHATRQDAPQPGVPTNMTCTPTSATRHSPLDNNEPKRYLSTVSAARHPAWVRSIEEPASVSPDPTPSAGVLAELQTVVDQAGPLRRHERRRYDPGWTFDVDVAGVCPSRRGRATMVVESFVGGGFAGQVYRVRLDSLDAPDGPLAGLEVGRTYAVKIMVPPSGFSLWFRNLIYGVAYQGPFSAQVHPAAARSGVLWQKLVRRAAEIEFGRPDAVCDTYATFYDDGLGSWGEINEWVDGRNWTFELDDRYFERQAPDPDDPAPDFQATGAPEYFAKKHFMARLVRLLHRMGAPELARQYEWWTAKSQPNVLKRLDAGDGPADGLTAIDFRAGLALLPVLPMSPADVRLILTGLRRGALVQFDRGDLDRLERFVEEHADRFDDLRPALEELKQADPAYRRSLIDLTHHGLRPLWDGPLRQSIIDGFAHHWRARHVVDEPHAERLRTSGLAFTGFFASGILFRLLALAVLVAAIPVSAALLQRWGLIGSAAPDSAEGTGDAAAATVSWIWTALGVIGAVVATLILLSLIPAAGRLLRRLWGDATYRLHVGAMLRRWSYLVRVLHARQAEILMDWHRAGRRSAAAVARLATCAWRFWPQAWTLGRLPAAWHRVLVEPRYAWNTLRRKVGGMILFIKDADFRRQWLEGIIDEGHRDGVLDDQEHTDLRASAADPYIKTYLLCLAGHFATLPVTQVVAIIFAVCWATYDGWSWGKFAAFTGISLAVAQSIPVSPGSICRGLIVLGVMIKRRNVRDFWVAAALSMVKYLGYLSFPIQMATRYPALSRLMAGRWARSTVGFVPVFGEHGALLERGVLDLCFNKPVSIRRRIAEGKETVLRLAAKLILAAEWLGGSALAIVLAWRLAGAGDTVTPADVWRAVLPGLAAAAALAVWAAGAPRFAAVRRVGWLPALVALVPAVAVIAAHWQVMI